MLVQSGKWRWGYLPAQDPRIATQFPEIPRRQYDTAVVLIEIPLG